ncbi:hypothetical protein PsYK624_065360 [Phanerochaete sordida]|uniref:Uncharacterized protein n=1 Tax=Phanerochaete sordida TaxID=48140 RepID=A0A9P3GAK2_9APHY|nr:hypothetical protein PsYK624_065360 [Phanerochaete sordida]
MIEVRKQGRRRRLRTAAGKRVRCRALPCLGPVLARTSSLHTTSTFLIIHLLRIRPGVFWSSTTEDLTSEGERSGPDSPTHAIH